MMSQTIRAVFQNGVFRPLEVPLLAENQEVQLTIEVEADSQQTVALDDPLAGVGAKTGITDLAEHFDDYRFGRRTP